jgi:hypothetical protein
MRERQNSISRLRLGPYLYFATALLTKPSILDNAVMKGGYGNAWAEI